MSLKQFIQEVHRRSLWQVLLIYLGASWGVLQVIDQIQERLALPAWVYGAAMIVLLIGLPIVLAAAIVQERPGDAANSEQTAPPPRLLTMRNAIGGGLLTFIIGGAALFAWLSFSPAARAGAAAGDRSIAVLPFANMSPNADDAFFADGIHDEILTHLSRIAALDVRSRTSVLEYKNTAKNLKQIARELGVRYILEGSVRRSGDQARITAQLIDAQTDKHMWAETYDGSRSDVFGMQTRVAEKIAGSLAAELSPAERARLQAQPTANNDAYDLYLRARDYGRRDYNRASFENAIKLASQAIALDARFAQAHAELSIALGYMYWFHYDRSRAIQDSARRSAERAIDLDAALPDGHIALGNYLYRIRLDYDGALKELRLAHAAAPNDAQLALDIGAVLRRRGDMAAALTEFERAVALDPRSALIRLNLGQTYALVRRYADAEATFQRGMDLAPDETDVAFGAIRMYVQGTGEVAKARRVIAQYPLDGKGEFSRVYSAAIVELLDRKPDAALSILQKTNEVVFQTQWYYLPRSLVMARAYQQQRAAAQARTYFARALVELDSALLGLRDDPRLYAARAHALAGLGQKQLAIGSARHATELLPYEKEAFRGSYLLRDLAEVYAATGEADAAIALLQRLLAMPAPLDVGSMRIDPAWDALRSDARFRKLIS